MRKKLCVISLLGAVLLSACSSTTSNIESQEILNQTIDSDSSIAEDTKEFIEISAEDFLHKLENKETFYLYVDTGYEPALKALGRLKKDQNILCASYLVKPNVNMPTEVVTLFNEYSSSESVENWNGLYSFKEGNLLFSTTNLRQYDATDSRDFIYMNLQACLLNSDLYTETHDFDVITFDEILTKAENNETFVVYIGRDTCMDCSIFLPSLLKAIENKNFEIPLYYLPAQSYKTAIMLNEPYAQETWDSLKDYFGITEIPALIKFDNSQKELYINFYPYSDYKDKTEEEQKQIQEDKMTDIQTWFIDNNICQ